MPSNTSKPVPPLKLVDSRDLIELGNKERAIKMQIDKIQGKLDRKKLKEET